MTTQTRGLVVALASFALCLAPVTAASAKPAGPGPGNSPNAKACKDGGWENLVRADGTGFGGESECTSYAARGGVLMAKPPPPATGDVTVAKVVSGAGVPPTGDFTFLVQCDDAGAFTTVLEIGAGESELAASDLPSGTTCSIEETDTQGADGTTVSVDPAANEVDRSDLAVDVVVGSGVTVTFDNRFDA